MFSWSSLSERWPHRSGIACPGIHVPEWWPVPLAIHNTHSSEFRIEFTSIVQNKYEWTYRFFELDLIYFNSKQFILEITIISEPVVIQNVPSLWNLSQDTSLTAGQRLKSSSEFTVLYRGEVFYVF